MINAAEDGIKDSDKNKAGTLLQQVVDTHGYTVSSLCKDARYKDILDVRTMPL